MKKSYFAFVEHCADTGLLVGSVPSLPGARAQAATPRELAENLKEVIELILDDLAERGEGAICGQAVGFMKVEVERP